MLCFQPSDRSLDCTLGGVARGVSKSESNRHVIAACEVSRDAVRVLGSECHVEKQARLSVREA